MKQTKIGDLVIRDMEDRVKLGLSRYGKYLTTNNGRNALQDAYEEALDLCMYLRQRLEEERD